MISKKQAGFTLVEIAIVVMVFGLILGGVLSTIAVQRQQLKRDETRQQLKVIKDALIGFAISNGRLPCPDTDGSGQENPVTPANGVSCTNNEGWLPHVDLGVGSFDSWGGRFRYRVTGTAPESFADAPPSLFGAPEASQSSFSIDPLAVGDITIEDEQGNSIADDVPAVVLSYAANWQATTANCATVSVREQINCDPNSSVFISSFYSDVAAQEFDDLIVWIPITVLKFRMLEAGRLP